MKRIISCLLGLSLIVNNCSGITAIYASTTSKEYEEDYTEWCSVSNVEYPPVLDKTYDYNGNQYPPFSSWIDNSFYFDTKSGKQDIKTYGSLLYCISYMMVASGMVNEYEDSNGSGFHPGMLIDAIYETKLAESWNSINDTSEVYSEIVNTACLDSAFKNTLKYCDSINIKDYKMSTKDIETKLLELMSKGKYVLLKYQDSKVHWVFVTGARLEPDKNYISILDPESNDTELKYQTENLLAIESWEPDKSLSTRLDWYRNYANSNKNNSIPVYLQLINRTNRITDIDIENQQYTTYLGAKINRLMYSDLNKMYKDCKEEGFDLQIEKGYESVEDTYDAYNLYTNNKDISDFMLERYLNKYESEHNVGIGIDIKNTYTDRDTLNNINKESNLITRYNKLDSEFKKTKYYTWLINNSYKYGFIYRYPADSSTITGLSEIPYHFRYIGIEYAKKYAEFTGATVDTDNKLKGIYSNGKTFEDFYEEVISKDFSNDELKKVSTEYDVAENYYSNNIIRMYAYIMDSPITCIGRFVSGIFQIFHNSVCTGGIGNIINCDFLINYMREHNIYLYIIVICSILFILAILYYIYIFIINMMTMKQLTFKFIKGLILITIPVLFMYYVGGILKSINNYGLNNISSRSSVYDLAKYKINSVDAEDSKDSDAYQRYEVYSDSDIQNMAFSDNLSNMDDYSSILFTKKGINGLATNTEIKISDLYEDVYGDTFYLSLKEDNSDKNPAKYMLYKYDEFVPVNYDKYDTSVFYYFYDYIMYQYLNYWGNNSKSNKGYSELAREFTGPQKIDGQFETLSVYSERIKKLQNDFISSSFDGVRSMYNDDKYVNSHDYIKDIFGLSYMFRMTKYSDNYSYVDDTYLNNVNLEDWSLAKYNEYMNSYGTYSDWLNDIENSNDNRSHIEVLSTISQGDSWIYYNRSKLGKSNSDSLKDYQFSPRYLQNEFKDTYYSVFNNTSILEKTDLSKINSSKRVPFRVYGSYGKLYQDTGECYYTKFEETLNSITENTYKNISNVINSYSGKVTDDILIFYCALEATSEFNHEFSEFGTNVNPQGISSESFDLDKLLKAIYCTKSISSYSQGFMYTCTSDYGLLTSFLILLFDIMITITGACRCLLLITMNLSVILACAKILFTIKFKINEYVVGVISQLSVMFLTQIIYVNVLKLISQYITTATKLNVIIITLALLILSILILAITISCTLCMIKSVSTFGGAKIVNVISKVSNEIKMLNSSKSDTIETDKVELDKETTEVVRDKINNDIKNLKLLSNETKDTKEDE